MEPIRATEENGNKYWEKIRKRYHEHQEYVAPNPVHATCNEGPFKHRWSIVHENVNKFVGHYVWLARIKVGLESTVT